MLIRDIMSKDQLLVAPQGGKWLLLTFLLLLLNFTLPFSVFLLNSSLGNHLLNTYNVLGSEQEDKVPAFTQLAFGRGRCNISEQM